MKTTYIYGVRDLETGEFVYTGKSNEPSGRFMVHMRHSDNSDLRELVGEKGADNFGLETLETVGYEVPRDWIKRERFWIAKLRKEGHPLCNKNAGGGGVTDHTAESKRKNSESNKGRIPWHKGKTGVYSDETLRAMREGFQKWLAENDHPALGTHLTDEQKQRQRESHLGHKHSEETKQKMRVSYNGAENNAQPYPALCNSELGIIIPQGRNFSRMCREYGLNYDKMYDVKTGNTKCTRDGWRLA